MEIKEFIESTVKNLDTKYYEYLKEKLLGEYLIFGFIPEDKLLKDAFCEKLMDYFEKVEIVVDEKFPKLLAKYVANLDEVVKRYIPKEPSAKKGEPIPSMPRSIKYYKHALEIKGSRNLTMRQVEDYSRIMLSLYMEAVNSGKKEVSEFKFSTEGLELDKIISALKTEKPGIAFPIGKKKLFNLEDLYSTDTLTFIMTVIMFCHIKNQASKGEY